MSRSGERGKQHEARYIDHLVAHNPEIATINGVDITAGTVADTLAATKAGKPVIVQGALQSDPWVGRLGSP